MLTYLKAEADFLRAFGNRSLLLAFLCALTRSATTSGKGSFVGLSLDLNQGQIIVFGPVVALLLLASLKLEADNLALARAIALNESSNRHQFGRPSAWTYALFCVPALAAAFMLVQFVTDLAPVATGCSGFHWTRHFTDFSVPAGPSVFCIRDVVTDMPWIYPPYQAYVYVLCLIACAYLTFAIWRSWATSRLLPASNAVATTRPVEPT